MKQIISLLVFMSISFAGFTQTIEGHPYLQKVSENRYNILINGGHYDNIYISKDVVMHISGLEDIEKLEVSFSNDYTEIIQAKDIITTNEWKIWTFDAIWLWIKVYFYTALSIFMLFLFIGWRTIGF